MQALLDFVRENPLYAAGAAVLLLFLLISLLKKGLKLAIVALALNAGYGYYLNDLAQEYYSKAQEKVEAAQRQYDSAKETVERAGNAAKAAGEAVDKAGDLFDQAEELVEH